jgi:hypothetical protein
MLFFVTTPKIRCSFRRIYLPLQYLKLYWLSGNGSAVRVSLTNGIRAVTLPRTMI